MNISLNIDFYQSNNPPIPTYSYSSFGGSGALGASFLVYLAASFFGASFSTAGFWGAEVRASTSGILNLLLEY